MTGYHTLSYSEKDRFLRFIYKLGEDGLKKLFKFPGEDFSFWWFSLVAEKSPLKSNSYERLISMLASGDKQKKKEPLWLRLQDFALLHFFKGLTAYFCFIFRIIRVNLFAYNSKTRKTALKDSDYVIVSYFPLLDRMKEKEGIFLNKYISSLHQELEEKRKNKYAHLCIQVNIDGYNLKDSISLANRFGRNQLIVFIEEFFVIRHIFLSLLYYFYFSFLFIFNINNIKKRVIYSYNDENYDIWFLLKKDFFKSFCGSALMSSIWHILLFKRIAGFLKKNSKVLCICEMQSWEKALYIFSKKNGLTTIGIQHSIVPELLLNYFNDAREIGKGNFIESCPLPDYLATVGNFTASRFIKYGWPKDKIFIWGAQRFNLFRDNPDKRILFEKRKNYFVCAFSIDKTETQNLLEMFSRWPCGEVKYKVLLKDHPALNSRRIISKARIKLNPNIFEYSDLGFPEIMREAKGLIVTESSSSFYALCCGIPVIVPRFFGKLDCNPLSYISDIPIYTYSVFDLKSVFENIIKPDYVPASTEKFDVFLNDYLFFPDRDYEYLRKIDNISFA